MGVDSCSGGPADPRCRRPAELTDSQLRPEFSYASKFFPVIQARLSVVSAVCRAACRGAADRTLPVHCAASPAYFRIHDSAAERSPSTSMVSPSSTYGPAGRIGAAARIGRQTPGNGLLGDQGRRVDRHPPPGRPRADRLRGTRCGILAGIRRQRQGSDHRTRRDEAPRRALEPARCGKRELLDHRRMEERIAAARVGRFFGKPAYHALTYGWLLSGLARAVAGLGMRDLFRTEVAGPSVPTGSTSEGRRPDRRLAPRGSSVRS